MKISRRRGCCYSKLLYDESKILECVLQSLLENLLPYSLSVLYCNWNSTATLKGRFPVLSSMLHYLLWAASQWTRFAVLTIQFMGVGHSGRNLCWRQSGKFREITSSFALEPVSQSSSPYEPSLLRTGQIGFCLLHGRTLLLVPLTVLNALASPQDHVFPHFLRNILISYFSVLVKGSDKKLQCISLSLPSVWREREIKSLLGNTNVSRRFSILLIVINTCRMRRRFPISFTVAQSCYL